MKSKKSSPTLKDLYDGLTINEYELLYGTIYDNAKIGDIVKLNVFSRPVRFRIVDKDYVTKNTLTLCIEDALFTSRWDTKSHRNDYRKSLIRWYCNNVIFAGFDKRIQERIIPRKYESFDNVKRHNITLEDKLIPVSRSEIDCKGLSDLMEGRTFNYFVNSKPKDKIRKLIGEPMYYWTRTPDTCSNNAICVQDNGYSDDVYTDKSFAVIFTFDFSLNKGVDNMEKNNYSKRTFTYEYDKNGRMERSTVTNKNGNPIQIIERKFDILDRISNIKYTYPENDSVVNEYHEYDDITGNMYVKVVRTHDYENTLIKEVWYTEHKKFKGKLFKQITKEYNDKTYGTKVTEDTYNYDEKGNKIERTREIYSID